MASSPVHLSWRRGGPVCGGRLGVVSYTVLHTMPLDMARGGGLPSLTVVHGMTAAVSASADSAVAEGIDGNEGGAAAGASVVPPGRLADAIHVAVNSGSPASFAPASLARHCKRLAKTTESEADFVCLVGHCRWGRGQLQNEVRPLGQGHGAGDV